MDGSRFHRIQFEIGTLLIILTSTEKWGFSEISRGKVFLWGTAPPHLLPIMAIPNEPK
jgi:hypothetical protein